jgi:hypothetical protein
MTVESYNCKYKVSVHTENKQTFKRMPLGVKPECAKCGSQETPLWHATVVGNICNYCHENDNPKTPQQSNNNNNDDDQQLKHLARPIRKSTRITRYNGQINKTFDQPHNVKTVHKGKGRRHIFKKMVLFNIFNLFIFILYFKFLSINFT